VADSKPYGCGKPDQGIVADSKPYAKIAAARRNAQPWPNTALQADAPDRRAFHTAIRKKRLPTWPCGRPGVRLNAIFGSNSSMPDT